MNKNQRECALARIDVYAKLLLADLLIFSALVGWIAARYEAGVFGAVFWLACGAAVVCGIIATWLTLAMFKRFTILEAPPK